MVYDWKSALVKEYMNLAVYEQIFELINKAGRILIVLPESLAMDSLSSGLALKHFLEKQKKDVNLACSGAVLEQFKFLPGTENIVSSLPSGKSMVIVVDTSEKKLAELSYETVGGKVSIFLKAESGQFGQEDISFGKEKAPYDLLFILDAPSFSSLGKIFEQNPDVFYETPKINIDHKADNEFFGAINLVDLAATSTAEILAGLFEKFEEHLVDEDIATCLLAGIVSKTDSFQHIKTTPKAFLTASGLVEAGARQQEIVQALYKTKSLKFLRLWGRVLAKLKSEAAPGVIYAVLTEQDFEKAGAEAEELPKVILEMLANISGRQILAIIAQNKNNGADILLALHNGAQVENFAAVFGQALKTVQLSPHNYRLYNFTLPGYGVNDAETKFLESLKGL